MSATATRLMPSITVSESKSTWPSAPQPMRAMLILLKADVFLPDAAELVSGLHEVSSSPAPAAAVAPRNSRRENSRLGWGGGTIFFEARICCILIGREAGGGR